jgi:hypothetical protein
VIRPPIPSAIRFRVDPGDVPPEKAGRRLGLTLDRFIEVLPRLLARGFPAPDQDTGNFALEAIDQWRKMRTPARIDRGLPGCAGYYGTRRRRQHGRSIH